jgi:hypothetical protein
MINRSQRRVFVLLEIRKDVRKGALMHVTEDWSDFDQLDTTSSRYMPLGPVSCACSCTAATAATANT